MKVIYNQGAGAIRGRFLARLAMHIGYSLAISQIVIAFSRLCDAHPSSQAGIRVAEVQGAESGSVPAQGVLAYRLPTKYMWKGSVGSVGEGLRKLSLFCHSLARQAIK